MTLEMVADRIGVTKRFIYAHFTSKSGFLAEICSRGIAWSIEAIDSVLPLRVPATEKLRFLGERFVTAVLGSQMHIAIFPSEETTWWQRISNESTKMRPAFDRRLAALLRRGIETDEFRVSDARLAALAIGGLVC